MAQLQEWQSYQELDAEWLETAKSIGGSPDLGAFPDIPTMRSILEASERRAGANTGPVPGVTEKDHEVEMRDGHKILVRTYHPDKPPDGGSPLCIIYHGGGWCLGNLVNEEPLCRAITANLGLVVANVDYRLAPEWKHPHAVNDCYDATKWVVANTSSLGANPSLGFTIGGVSAGGNIACVISHLWRDNKHSPPITGVHLMIPATCDVSAVPEELKADYRSWHELEHAPILSRKACDLFLNAYIPEIKDRKDPSFSPLLFPTGHKGLPPHYFQICGADPLRDEALIYERILREQDGVVTKVEIYPGQPHGFWSIFPQMKASRKFVEDSIHGHQWLLDQKWKI